MVAIDTHAATVTAPCAPSATRIVFYLLPTVHTADTPSYQSLTKSKTMKKLLLPIILLLATACTDDAAARRTLQAQGLTDVTITGWSAFSCSEDDFTSTGFKATNVQGNRVSGAVCCGMLFKNCTIRW